MAEAAYVQQPSQSCMHRLMPKLISRLHAPAAVLGVALGLLARHVARAPSIVVPGSSLGIVTLGGAKAGISVNKETKAGIESVARIRSKALSAPEAPCKCSLLLGSRAVSKDASLPN